MVRAFWLAVVLCGFSGSGNASTIVYFNQAQWQAAMMANGNDLLSNINFDSSQWTSAFQASARFDSLTSQANFGNGMTISAVSGYDPFGVANNALLGQANNGVWSDTISKYGATQFNFSTALYGFGGNFNISGANGLEIIPGAGPAFNTPSGIYNGFVGVVSTQAFSNILITWGDNGNCGECFGNSYTLSNFEVASGPLATPEPDYFYGVAGLLLVGITVGVRRGF